MVEKKKRIRMAIYSEATYPFFRGGGEIFLDRFAKFFRDLGYEVTIISNKISKEEKIVEEVNGIKFYRALPTIPPPSYYGWPRTLVGKLLFVLKKSIREFIKVFIYLYVLYKFKPHILVLNGVTATSIPSFLPGATFLKSWRIVHKLSSHTKVLLIVHAINPPRGIVLKNTLADASKADIVVCVEKWMKDFLQEKLPGKEIVWIHNGVDVRHFSFKPVTKSGNILFVGRLSEDHGLDVLLKAVSKIISEYPWIMVRVVGEGPQKKEYIELAKQLGLHHVVDFRGGVDYEDMPKEYHWAFIAVNPVKVAGIGITTLEAMSCGRIVLKSTVNGDDVIVDGVNGFLFKLGDPDSLAEKLRECLEMSEYKAEAIGKRARETVVKRFNLLDVFNRYAAIIRDLVS